MARRDPELPGLPLLLDDEALLHWLQENPPQADGWTDVPLRLVCRRVRYRPGVHLVGAYEMRTGSGFVLPFQARAMRRDDVSGFEQAIRGLPPAFAPRRRWDRQLRVVVRFHPDDEGLPNLAWFMDPGVREALLGRRIPPLAGRFRSALRILSYDPGRRFVALLRDRTGPAAVVRGFTHRGFHRSLPGSRALRTEGTGFRVPDLLGASADAAVIIEEWLGGESQAPGAWGRRSPTEASILAARIGTALHDLHARNAPGLRPERLRLEQHVGSIEAIRPGATGRAAGAVARAVQDLLDGSGASGRSGAATVHGDFHPGTVLVSGRELCLLDPGTAARGDPAADLATFVAHLEAGRADGRIPDAVCPAVEEGLLEGYQSAGGHVDPVRYRLHAAAALLRQAWRPFRDRTPDWPLITDHLVEAAAERLSAP